MNCFDCHHPGLPVAAVAICHDCGAGVCADHAVVHPHHLTRTATINRIIVVEPPARLIRCITCATAHDAADHPVQRHHQLFERHTKLSAAGHG